MERLIIKYQKVLEHFHKQRSEMRRLWNIDERSARLLYMLLLIRRAKYILEIGTSNGYSTFWLAAAAKETGGKVHTIEVDENRFKLAKDNLKGLTNVIQYLSKAEDILPDFKPGIDFLFIDAGKPGYIDYLKLVEDKLVPQAVVIADNITTHPGTTASYKNYIENNPAYLSIVHDIDAGLMISYFSGY